MSSLRQRISFTFTDNAEHPEDEDRILDDEEQDDLVQKLRDSNAAANRLHLQLIEGLIFISFLLHISHFFFLSTTTPSQPPFNLAIPFYFVSLALHLNLLALIRPDRVKDFQFLPLSYSWTYALSAVAPTVCILSGKPWPTSAWWSLVIVITFFTQIVQDSIAGGDDSIAALERMKYTAPGA